EKTEGERFPGAVETWCIESMMQDRKALQAGTSHFLGQNFAKAQEIQFQDDEGNREFCWTTSWGVSTRLIGGTIMTHADDDGMICPPMVAPAHIIIQPVLHKAESKDEVMAFCDKLIEALKTKVYGGRVIEVEYDTRDLRGGDKTWQWIKRGAPIRLEVGPRDVAEGNVFMARRDKGPKDKQSLKLEEFVEQAADILQEIQDGLFARAKAFRKANTHVIDTEEAFYEFFKTPETANNETAPIHAGFVMAHFNGDPKLEERIKNDLAVTVRCIPLDGQKLCDDDGRPGTCPFTGEPSAKRVVWAKSY
ncbi:MAG: proline--tRNA ligase, partial [Phycisphaera sp. TMED9]